MKTAKMSIFVTVLLGGLLAGRATLQAQPASAPMTTESADKPWNRGVSIANRELARDLFLEGNRLFNIPLYTRAIEKYLAALAKWRHPAFYFNLALAQLNLGQDVEARDSLEQALKHGLEPLGADQFREAQKQLHDVERQLGRIRISCPTPGAEVSLDGSMLFVGPGSRERWLKAAAHEITAKKKPDYLSEARRVTVSPGKLHEVDLRLVTLSEASDTGRRWATWKPWTVVATGGVIAAAGGVLHALSFRNFNAYDKGFSTLDCAKSIGCTQDQIGPTLNNQLTLATQEQKIAIGGYVAGGSILAVGLALVYLNRPHLSEGTERTSNASGVTMLPTLSINSFGLLTIF